MLDIQWYPGHMAKAKRLITDQLKLIDVVVELCDARLPMGSRNPDIDSLCTHKRRVLVLNKSDLANERRTREWIKYFENSGIHTLAFSAKNSSPTQIKDAVKKAAGDLTERMKSKGAIKTVRMMVCGIPNVGKSTVINRLYGSAATKVGDRPGVTRGKQWVKLEPYLEVLDTPGLLWPKLADKEAALKLAFLGSVRDEIMDAEQLAGLLLLELMNQDSRAVISRFKIAPESLPTLFVGVPENASDVNISNPLTDAPPTTQQFESPTQQFELPTQQFDSPTQQYESPTQQFESSIPQILLEAACKGRGFLLSGGRVDTARGAAVVLDEFRAGKLGRQTLETIPKDSSQRTKYETIEKG